MSVLVKVTRAPTGTRISCGDRPLAETVTTVPVPGGVGVPVGEAGVLVPDGDVIAPDPPPHAAISSTASPRPHRTVIV